MGKTKEQTSHGVQGKLSTPFIFEHNPYRNTWKFQPNFLLSLEQAVEFKPTIKIDGECYWLDQNNKWFGRRDLRINKKFKKLKNQGKLTDSHFHQTLNLKQAQDPTMKDWIPCSNPDLKGGHWFGWLPVESAPQEFKWALEAIRHQNFLPDNEIRSNQTYELLGPKVQGNPYGLSQHILCRHGEFVLDLPRETFQTPESIEQLFETPEIQRLEGLVIWLDGKPIWKIHHGHIHHGDDQKAKSWRENPFIPDEIRKFLI